MSALSLQYASETNGLVLCSRVKELIFANSFETLLAFRAYPDSEQTWAPVSGDLMSFA